MTQLALFGAPSVPGPRPSDASLLLLAEVAHCIDHGHDDGIGAPEAGQKARTVDSCETGGWIERRYVGDADTEQGPRRLLLTAAGRDALDAWGADHARYVHARATGRAS